MQRLDIVDVVEERGEPHLPIPGCCHTYPLQRTVRVVSARCPERVLPVRIPLDQFPSLHLLRRRRRAGLVRKLLRYYGTVRLPMPVHHRRMSLDFPTRPAAPSAAGGHRTSRFSNKVFPYMPGVCDRAGSVRISRWRYARCCLPPSPTTSASRSSTLSRLNTLPAPAPVNASVPPYGVPRMTRGQRGSLALHCVALSSTTPRRFIPTHGTPVLLFNRKRRNLRFRRKRGESLRTLTPS